MVTYQKELKTTGYLNYFGTMVTNDARCTRKNKCRITITKAAFNRKNLFISKLDLNLRKKLVRWYIWSTTIYGAETWTLRTADYKHLESFEMWCWTRMVKISWTERVRNEEVAYRVKDEENRLHTIKKEKGYLDWSHLVYVLPFKTH
jgi:hypothetical protein